MNNRRKTMLVKVWTAAVSIAVLFCVSIPCIGADQPDHQIQSGRSSLITSVVLSPDGKTSQPDSGKPATKPEPGQTQPSCVYSVAFSPDGKTLASGSGDKTIKLWDVASGNELFTLSGHTNYVCAVAFSPDGKKLASGSADKSIKLWDVTSGKELLYRPLKERIAFTPSRGNHPT